MASGRNFNADGAGAPAALLVMDEPASGLDPVARRHFMQGGYWKSPAIPGRTIFYSSHIVSDIERVANQVWILREGRKSSGAANSSRSRNPWSGCSCAPTTTCRRNSRLPGQLASVVHGRTATITLGGWQTLAACRTRTADRQQHRSGRAGPGGHLPGGACMKTFLQLLGVAFWMLPVQRR